VEPDRKSAGIKSQRILSLLYPATRVGARYCMPSLIATRSCILFPLAAQQFLKAFWTFLVDVDNDESANPPR